ncbi:18337_t:CDS:2, partial [Gigaspora rosea]
MFFFDKGRNNGEGKGIMKFKGIKKILEKRDIWNGQKLDYKRKKGDKKASCVPEILDSRLLPMIRKFIRRAWGYIEAYAIGLEGYDAERAVKQFKLHKRLR